MRMLQNRPRNAFLSWSHDVIKPFCKEWNPALALSLDEKGKRCSFMASGVTPFAFKVPLSLRKVAIWRFGSWEGDPENWFCCTKLSSACLISNFFCINWWVHNNSLWLFCRRGYKLFESAFLSHIVSIIACFSSSCMKIPFDLGNKITKTFGSSHSRIRESKSWKKKEKFQSNQY